MIHEMLFKGCTPARCKQRPGREHGAILKWVSPFAEQVPDPGQANEQAANESCREDPTPGQKRTHPKEAHRRVLPDDLF
jgi:hypothetical protein